MGSNVKKVDQKSNSNLILITLLILGIIAAVFLVINRASLFSQTADPNLYKYEQKVIENSSDLIKASDELDNSNVDSLDTELTQNESDSADF